MKAPSCVRERCKTYRMIPECLKCTWAVRRKRHMLETTNLNIFYGDSHVVRDVSFLIPEGKIVCLMGRNGVGKTTVMKTLMGLLPARGGRITFGGEDITNLRPYFRARSGIGYAPQGRENIPNPTAEENT